MPQQQNRWGQRKHPRTERCGDPERLVRPGDVQRKHKRHRAAQTAEGHDKLQKTTTIRFREIDHWGCTCMRHVILRLRPRLARLANKNTCAARATMQRHTAITASKQQPGTLIGVRTDSCKHTTIQRSKLTGQPNVVRVTRARIEADSQSQQGSEGGTMGATKAVTPERQRHTEIQEQERLGTRGQRCEHSTTAFEHAIRGGNDPSKGTLRGTADGATKGQPWTDLSW